MQSPLYRISCLICRPAVFASLVAVVVYSPSVFLYFLSDDFLLIEQSRRTSLPDLFVATISGYYRPVLQALYKLQHSVWAASPSGYHGVNVLLHAINTSLVHETAKALSSDRKVAGWAALIFAITPVHSSSVLWVSGLGDVLCGTFYFASVYLFVTWSGRGRLRIAMSVLFFGLALLSKEMAGSLPLVLFCVALWMERDGQVGRRALEATGRALPFFLVLLAYLAYRYWVFGDFFTSTTHSNQDPLHLLRIAARYTVTLILPVDLEWLKPFVRSHPSVLIAGSIVVLVVALAVAQRAVRIPLLVLSTVWVILTLLPVARLYAPWYLYIPSFGIALAWGWLIDQISTACRPRIYRAVLVAFLVVNAVGLVDIGNRTWIASRITKDSLQKLSEVPPETIAVLHTLPSEWQGIPVFGWPGNVGYALQLLGLPVKANVLSCLRLTDLSAEVRVERTSRDAVTASIVDTESFFRIMDSEVISGSLVPRAGSTFHVFGASIQVIELNATRQPSVVEIRSPLLASERVQEFAFTRGSLVRIR